MQRFGSDAEIVTEGSTKILVPSASLSMKVPPREPAFFNPRARLNRDMAVLAYSAFFRGFGGPKILLDGLAGLGARGLRVANEVPSVERVVSNDANPSAVALALESAGINNLENFEASENEVCRFLSGLARSGCRGAAVDLDPFGSPARYIDCGIRATMHGGIMAVTATDLQVLSGLFQGACRRRYGGVTARVPYLNELAMRLILGCIRSIAGRLDIEVQPLLAETDQHYYRVYVRVLVRRDVNENLGYILHCGCGHRSVSVEGGRTCFRCGSAAAPAGPLWIGDLFEREFVDGMLGEVDSHEVDGRCRKVLERCAEESGMPPTYHTLDEVASRAGRSPRKLHDSVRRLKESGFAASVTSLEPTGFRTDAGIDEIAEALY